MSANQCYEVVETSTRGKIVVATRDILPGEVVVNDLEPVLTFDAKFLKVYETENPHETALFLAAFSKYRKVLTPEKKEKFATLFGPTTGSVADGLRSMAATIVNNDGDKPRSLTPEEVEIFVRVANVVRLNAFGKTGERWSVFGEATRLAHSCAPNCNYNLVGPACIVNAIKHVKKGEELTISYMFTRDLLPTHVRRQKYLDAKEFTCHCPRCDAAGDDTRQLNCFDSACNGVMMVCQPINQEQINTRDLMYTGVEYVEPHLLPCTVCRRAAPPAYQTEMLAFESTFSKQAQALTEKFDELMARRAYGEMEVLLGQVQRFPSRHVACWPILLVKLKLLDHLSGVRRVLPRAHLTAALLEYFAVHEKTFPYPADKVCDNLVGACVMFCSSMTLVKVVPPLKEKELWQMQLRMYMILHGREQRNSHMDTFLLAVLEKLPPPQLQSAEQLCAFCEESPLRAALSLSRCGRCRQVCYCSAGCQKAHWKLHKKSCKAAAK